MLKRRHFIRYSSLLAGGVCLSTALSGCSLNAARPRLPALRFTHGIASGDPLADAVMLWTRAVPVDGAAGELEVGWELAEDPDFRRPLRSGTAFTSAARDWTVKVDVRELAPGRDYYYRFSGAQGAGASGRTRTLPAGSPSQVRLAVFSCSNYPAGYFHAYREASRLADIDAYLHLGDYLYEYGAGGYATERAAELGRSLPADNASELLSLDDYRRRYALYRSDADLQAVHAAGPMIVVWDDHEIANDSWRGGAQNHDPGEGDFQERRAAAVQAYFEWLPLRPPGPESEAQIYRGFDFGDLLSLHMLDTRLVGRDRQLEYSHFMDADSGRMRRDELLAQLTDPRRSMLGDEQRQWLERRFRESAGHWQVLGQQVLMARMSMPAQLLQTLFAGRDFAAAGRLIEELAALRARAARGDTLSAVARARLRSAMPYNLDAWDGYPAERERVYAMARQSGRPLVVLSGDTHNAWYSQLRDRSGHALGVEFATPGVSSPGMESYLDLGDPQARRLAAALPQLIAELRYCELRRRGFMELSFTREAVSSRWHFVDDVQRRDYRMATHEERYSA